MLIMESIGDLSSYLSVIVKSRTTMQKGTTTRSSKFRKKLMYTEIHHTAKQTSDYQA